MKVGLFILTIAAFITGCASKQAFVETDYPVIEEQDTPFIFKQAYQHTGAVVTQTSLPVASDFVVIAESEQYVFWRPVAQQALIVEPVTDTASDVTDDKVERPTEDAEIAPQEADNEVKDTLDSSLIVRDDEIVSGECTKILCNDESHCGNIEKCGTAPCDSSFTGSYACVGEGCSAFSVDYEPTAKANPDCQKHPHLFECPTMTSCKEKV
jgi:hypothetical protein